MCTLTTDYLRSKWSRWRRWWWCWGGLRLFSVSVVLTGAVCGTNISGADSDASEQLRPWTLTPFDPAVWNAPRRDGERQSPCVSCLTETSESSGDKCQRGGGGRGGKTDGREKEGGRGVKAVQGQCKDFKAPSVGELTYCHNYPFCSYFTILYPSNTRPALLTQTLEWLRSEKWPFLLAERKNIYSHLQPSLFTHTSVTENTHTRTLETLRRLQWALINRCAQAPGARDALDRGLQRIPHPWKHAHTHTRGRRRSCVESRSATTRAPGSHSRMRHSYHINATLTLPRAVSQGREETQWGALMTEASESREDGGRGPEEGHGLVFSPRPWLMVF